MAAEQACEEIDIEALLVRAYFEKRIDRLGGGVATMAALGMAKGPRAPISIMGAGEKVDTSSYATRMAAQMRELELCLRRAPSALLTLHDAVLALPDFYAEISGLDFVVWDVETAANLGHHIDADRDRPTVVADGGEPRALIRIVTATLMIVQGREARPPEVAEVEIARMRPVYSGEHRKVTGHVPEYVVSPIEVAYDRARYSAWHCALGMLAAALDLPGYRITGPRASAAPWDIERHILLGNPLPGLVDAPADGLQHKPLRKKKKAVRKAA